MDARESLRVSEEKKKYIVDLVNPLLEEMVAECIHKSPDDPVIFMLDWLETKKANDMDRKLDPQEKEQLIKQNAELEGNMAKVKSQMQEAAKLAHDAEANTKAKEEQEEEEEEEEDDEDGGPPPGWEKSEEQMVSCRKSVSAEAYGEWNTKKAFVPPVIPKTDEQKKRLQQVLGKSFLFQSLDEQELMFVVGAMKEINTKKGQRVINQGENGDFLFIIESGKLDCIVKNGDGGEMVVKTCEAGDVFGELALLYNCPRAASVDCKDTCVLWQLDRDTFSNIVKEAAQKKRQKYDTFLCKVPLLQNMSAYERSQLADALRSETFEDGAVIVKQDDLGAKFYIIEDGGAVAHKNGQRVMTYDVGDYFGELALIRDQPRAATVSAKGPTKVLSLDRLGFQRLIPPSSFFKNSPYT